MPAGGFLARRWRGEVPLRRLLWRDTLLLGSGVNVLASVAALVAVVLKLPSGLAVALHFMPLPFNAFLLAALWRHPQRTAVTTGVAGLWFLLATLV